MMNPTAAVVAGVALSVPIILSGARAGSGIAGPLLGVLPMVLCRTKGIPTAPTPLDLRYLSAKTREARKPWG